MLAFIGLALFLGLASANQGHPNGCPNRAFLGCILALKEDHIQFDRNIVRTILSIDSEAKLIHTCKAYTKVLPCFRDKVLECGNQHQRELFGEVGRALMFLCSPFSLQRQRVLVEKQNCISKVLSLPISVGCKLPQKPYGKQLMEC
uniref:Secreted protein n=2 Tax=Bursaphelenchus xylophilus TaxID=6326 RepID=A0A1I7SIX7_BURXY